MGQAFSNGKTPPASAGCWWKYDDSLQVPWAFVNTASITRTYDCDCREIGYCSFGRPPPPIVTEFLDMTGHEEVDIPIPALQRPSFEDWDTAFDFEGGKVLPVRPPRLIRAKRAYAKEAQDTFLRMDEKEMRELFHMYGIEYKAPLAFA